MPAILYARDFISGSGKTTLGADMLRRVVAEHPDTIVVFDDFEATPADLAERMKAIGLDVINPRSVQVVDSVAEPMISGPLTEAIEKVMAAKAGEVVTVTYKYVPTVKEAPDRPWLDRGGRHDRTRSQRGKKGKRR